MDELIRARAELVLLEERPRELLQQLLDVRAAVVAQRSKIDEIIRSRPTVISRLPIELLLSIIHIDIHASYAPQKRKQELASVSRRWRDVILHSPCLWTTVHVASGISSTKTHLERSRGALLDIVIEAAGWSRSKHLALVPCLDIVESHAHRWRSLLVTSSDEHVGDDNDDEMPLTEFIGEKIKHLQFPSLKRVAILGPSTYCGIGYLDFLSVDHAPALEHLELEEFTTLHDIAKPITMLKTLRLEFCVGSGGIGYVPFPYLIPTQALTKLSLSGCMAIFLPPQNSIHFPSLKTLQMFYVTEIRPFMNVLVAPNLEEFDCIPMGDGDASSVAWSGLSFKFTHVRHLSFSRSGSAETYRTPEILYDDIMALCKTFPGVHHVELDAEYLPYLVKPTPIQEPSSNSYGRLPIDLWTELQSLTLDGLHSKWLDPNQFLAWLVDRQMLGLRQLHVKLKNLCSYGTDENHVEHYFPPLYEHLKENCILELDNFPLSLCIHLSSMPADSSLRLHSAKLPTSLMVDVAAAILAGDMDPNVVSLASE